MLQFALQALRLTRQIVLMAWASPYSLIGLSVGLLSVATGGRMQVRGPTLEFYDGLVKRLIQSLPNGQFVLALTLGHTILGQSSASLDVAREHERVHVRQFERWGIVMGPAYLLCSAWIWMRGGNAYRDNPFEKEAYGD